MSFVSGLNEFVQQSRGGGEFYASTPSAGGQTQSQGYMGLAGATVAQGDDVLTPVHALTAGQVQHQGLVQGGLSTPRVGG